MERSEALKHIADGHAIWKEATAREVLEALKVPWEDRFVHDWYSEPGVPKGAMINPGDEGMLGASALELGSIALHHYGLRSEPKWGRGSQGQANADALREHFILMDILAEEARVDDLLA